MRLPPLPSTRDIIRVYKLRAIKQLSQNFILNERINKKIVKAAGKIVDYHVCEVGPGPGGITRAILQAGVKHLTVIEKDRRFLPSLELLKEASPVPFDMNFGDVLYFDMKSIFSEELKKSWFDDCPNIHIIGNLPFSVSTPLIIKWLEAISRQSGPWSYGRTRLTLTFQKEVAERMVAEPCGIQRSRLSIMCQNYCDVKWRFTLAGSVFVPPPDVDVGVVSFTPLKEPHINVAFKVLEKVTRLVFQHRNKTFKNCCELFFPPDQPHLMEEIVLKSEIPLTSRPRQLTMDNFKRLCLVYNDICSRNHGIFDYNFRDKHEAVRWGQRKKIWRELSDSNAESDDNPIITKMFEDYIEQLKEPGSHQKRKKYRLRI